MKKLNCFIVVFLFQIASVNAQFADTLTVVEFETDEPTFYKIAFKKRGADYFYITGNKEEKVFYSEIKNGLTRHIMNDNDGGYSVHLINNAGKGYYQYLPVVSLDSLSYAKSYTPDLKVFDYGFTNAGLTTYMKIPALDTLAKSEVRNFIIYQYNTLLALKNLCDYLVKYTGMRDGFKTSKELYTVLRERFQTLSILNWLTGNGYSGASYSTFGFNLILSSDKALEALADEYAKKEEAFYK